MIQHGGCAGAASGQFEFIPALKSFHLRAAIHMCLLVSMRRKRYTHERKGTQEQSALVEEIETYYLRLSQDTKSCDIPITSIHNLVGTALVACSVTPLDLSSIQRLLPNNTQEKLKFAAITIANFQAYMHSVTLLPVAKWY